MRVFSEKSHLSRDLKEVTEKLCSYIGKSVIGKGNR